MKLSNEIIEEIKKVNSIEELKQKVKDNSLDFNDEEIEKAYNLYHQKELNDEELDNVTGGCGYPAVDSYAEGCDDFVRMYDYHLINKQQTKEIFGDNPVYIRCLSCLCNRYNEEKKVDECQKSDFDDTPFASYPRY